MPTMVRAFRLFLLASSALLAAAAPAITLNIESIGTRVDYDDSAGGGDFVLGAEQTDFPVQDTTPAVAPFTNVYLAVIGSGGVEDGLLAYRDDLTLNALNLALTVGSDLETNGLRTIDGTWEYQTGLGDYDGFDPATSTGQWSFVWNRTDDTTRLTLSGRLAGSNPAPEPAPLAVLALGAAALMRRKRR